MEMLTTLLWRLYIDQYVVRARIHPRIGSASLVSLLGHQKELVFAISNVFYHPLFFVFNIGTQNNLPKTRGNS